MRSNGSDKTSRAFGFAVVKVSAGGTVLTVADGRPNGVRWLARPLIKANLPVGSFFPKQIEPLRLGGTRVAE